MSQTQMYQSIFHYSYLHCHIFSILNSLNNYTEKFKHKLSNTVLEHLSLFLLDSRHDDISVSYTEVPNTKIFVMQPTLLNTFRYRV